MVGETHYTYSGQTLGSAHIEFDSNEGWSLSGTHAVSAQGVGLFPVALHEIGHGGVGLNHYDAVPAIMNTILTPSVTDLEFRVCWARGCASGLCLIAAFTAPGGRRT